MNSQTISKGNTQVNQLPDGAMSVTLHSTEIVRYWPQYRKVRLSSGGWATATTRTRMNQALNEWHIPASVFIRAGQLHLSVDGREESFSRDGICYFTF